MVTHERLLHLVLVSIYGFLNDVCGRGVRHPSRHSPSQGIQDQLREVLLKQQEVLLKQQEALLKQQAHNPLEHQGHSRDMLRGHSPSQGLRHHANAR